MASLRTARAPVSTIPAPVPRRHVGRQRRRPPSEGNSRRDSSQHYNCSAAPPRPQAPLHNRDQGARSLKATRLLAIADDGELPSVERLAAPVVNKQPGLWGELGEVMRFSLPAVGIFLVNPLMTLVDTAFLGAGPAAEQAALNPSGAVLDYPTILLSFIAVATTSLVAQNPGSTQNARNVLRPALCLGLALGFGMMLFCQLGAPHILTALGVRPEVYEAAMTYIRIRQLYCPLVLVCSVAQSAYLASKDVYTPLKLVILSGCINCFGDMLLVGKLGMGVAGAAWATVASQFCLVGGLLVGLMRSGKLPPLLPLPRLAEYEPFAGFAKGITMINMLRVTGFASITYYASRCLTTEHLAAQQVLTSVFIFLSIISQPLLQCCQAFLPSLLPEGATPNFAKAKSTMNAIFATALCLGVVCGLTGTVVMCFGHGMFTTDATVVKHMYGGILAVLYCHLIAPIALSVDAVLVAAKDLDSLCWIQAVGLAILLSFMGIASAQGMGLSAIWIAYGSHLIARLALCSWRINKVIPGLLPGQALMAKTH